MNDHNKPYVSGHQLSDSRGDLAAYCWQVFDKEKVPSRHSSSPHSHDEKAHVTIGVTETNNVTPDKYLFAFEISAPDETDRESLLAIIKNAFETQYKLQGFNIDKKSTRLLDPPGPTWVGAKMCASDKNSVYEYEIIFPFPITAGQAKKFYDGVQQLLNSDKGRASLLGAVLPRGTSFREKIALISSRPVDTGAMFFR